MSKIKIFFFCFLILILSFFSACSKKEKNAGLKNPNQNAGQYDLMRYLPYDSMIVFRCKDLNKTYSEFINGAFYKQLTSYPAVQEFKTEIEKLDASEFEKNFKFKPAVSDFIDLIGNDFAFSFTLKNGMPYFMILSEFSSDSALKKIDENLQYFLSGSKEASISATEYNSAKIKTLKFSLRGGGLLALNALDEETAYEISFCITDKILFISNDVELIKKSADTASGIQTKSILDNLEFQKTFQKIGLNKQVSIYFKPNEISETLLNLPALSKNKNAKEAFELWNNITATGSSFDVRTKTIIKSYTLYNQYAKNQKLLEIYKKKSGELDSARFVPMNAMLFLTTNLLDASGIYEYYINALPPQLKENADGLIKNFEKNIRLSFRKDFLENFKGQVSLALFDIDLNSIVSNPLNALNSIALFAEVKDKKKIDLIFQNSEKFLAKEGRRPGDFRLEKSEYKNNQINKLMIAGTKLNPPSYFFKDNFMVISSEKNIKNIIDSPKEKTLDKLEKIAEMKNVLTDANGFFYFDFKQFASIASDIVGVFIDESNPKDALAYYVKPAIELLSYIDCFSGYSKNDDSGSLSELYIFTAVPKDNAPINSRINEKFKTSEKE